MLLIKNIIKGRKNFCVFILLLLCQTIHWENLFFSPMMPPAPFHLTLDGENDFEAVIQKLFLWITKIIYWLSGQYSCLTNILLIKNNSVLEKISFFMTWFDMVPPI